MPQITVTQPFKFAHGGHQVEEFDVSEEPRETTDECAELAIAEGWAVAVQTPAPAPAPVPTPEPEVPETAPEPEAHAHEAAPENRDAAHKRKPKASPDTAE